MTNCIVVFRIDYRCIFVIGLQSPVDKKQHKKSYVLRSHIFDQTITYLARVVLASIVYFTFIEIFYCKATNNIIWTWYAEAIASDDRWK